MPTDAQPCSPDATRRVPLSVDAQGNPCFSSTLSPTSFKQSARCVLPPSHTIPVIFIPGIMGTDLKNTQLNQQVWTPPNSMLAGIGQMLSRAVQSPSSRQKEMDPANTVVDPDGPCTIPSHCYTLTTEEAKRRGWGALHKDSYQDFLQKLEYCLNEQYYRPGFSKDEGNHLLEELGLLTKLGASAGENAPAPANGQAAPPDYQAAATESTKAWGMAPPSLSQAQLERFERFYFPVWAHGYNWLQSNGDSAAALVKRIDEVLAFYRQSSYFRLCDNKVILVSHSMGGLVARCAAQQRPGNILGVIHGVQPVTGAPVVYRRFRAGTEAYNAKGVGFAAIAGWSAADVTPEMACAPGPLELLPTKHYPPGWLKFTQNGSEAMPPLPVADPYDEIYSKSTDDCWWGMVNPKLIDPAGIVQQNLDQVKKGQHPIDAYINVLHVAKKFHENLGLAGHDFTYGFYGNDEAKPNRTFGSVSWETTDTVPSGTAGSLSNVTTQDFNNQGKSNVTLAEGPTLTFELRHEQDQAGDGTVPLASGAALKQLIPPPKQAFAISGVEHQKGFDNEFALRAALYGIVSLAQLAPDPSA